MKLKINIELEIIDIDKVREVYSKLEDYNNYDAMSANIAKVVEDLILNLDKLPSVIKRECKDDSSLNCLGLFIEDTYSRIIVEEFEAVE